MSDTLEIYAYGFPDIEEYNSILNDESINAKVFSDIKLLLNESVNGERLLFIYFPAFENYIVDLMDILVRRHKKNPIVMIGDKYSQDYLEVLFKHHYFTYIKLPDDREKIIDALKRAKVKDCIHKPINDLEEELNKAKKEIIALNNVAIALKTQKTDLQSAF